MNPLAKEALEFVQRHPRRNPPEAAEIDERVQGFCVEKKTAGDDLGKYDDGEWREALEALGVSDADLPSYLEDVASWGVDG